ncbi:MAG: HAMP domain-containing histidine kinase [Lachnospiraceae bacterium]
MKKLVSNLLRYILIFIALIAGCICVFSITVIVLAFSIGAYNNDLSTITNNGRKNLSGLYSRYIFENMKRSGKPECMEKSNLQYVIVKGINPGKEIDSAENKKVISDKDNIIYTNLGIYGEEPDEFYYDNYKIFYEEEPLTNKPLGIIRSLFDDGGGHHKFNNYKSYKEYVYRIFYKDGIFYFETENYAFPAYSIEIPAASLSSSDYKILKGQGYISGKKDYVLYESGYNKEGNLFYRCPWLYNMVLDTSSYQKWQGLLINGISFNPGTIKNGKPGKNIKIFELGKKDNYYSSNIENYDNYAKDSKNQVNLDYMDIVISYEIEDNTYNNVYAILTNVKPPFDRSTGDLFYSQKKLIKFLYKTRYSFITITAVSLIVFTILLIFCCYSRYLCPDNNKAVKNIFHRIPFLLYLVIIISILALDIFTGIELLNGSIPYADNLKVLAFLCFLAALWIMSCIFLFIMICMEISCRLGAGIFLKSTVLYFIYNIFKKAFISLKDAYNKANRSLTFFTRTLLILVMVNLLIISGFVLNAVNSRRTDIGYSMVFIVFAICVLLDFFLLKIVLQMTALQVHAREMASGNLENKTDTSKMAWEFKKHGEYLNQIGEGMALAVNERIKSEHFKTELITNVSHDIKTPLTSIINYTGLLKKENIQLPQAQEYIEVLERQSARLKKLIEDLMEASKASTGNVTVELGLCDINILLTQAIGEFEEKLNGKELELIINKSQEDVFIMADNRHIWRIFDNLMNNICKYGQPGTRVYINIEQKDTKVLIIFRNTSKYQLNISSDELLERFVRGDSSRHTEGNGLGLSIAQNLAELMGGSLKLHVDGDLFKVVLEFPKAVQP